MPTKLIKTKGLQQFVKDQGFRLSNKTPEALEEILCRIVERACQRCENNGRKTVIPGDL